VGVGMVLGFRVWGGCWGGVLSMIRVPVGWTSLMVGFIGWINSDNPWIPSAEQPTQARFSKSASEFFCNIVVSTQTHKTRRYSIKLSDHSDCRSCH
jgi:hypothetical protein